MVVERRSDLMPPGRKVGSGNGGSRREELLAWGREYRDKGMIWRGAPRRLPPLPEGARVLELGCGNGKTLQGMLGRPWRVAAVDVSPQALRLGKGLAEEMCRRGDHLRPEPSTPSGVPPPPAPPAGRVPPANRLEFVAADAVQLPFRDSSFDAVFAFHVLGHLREGDRIKAAGEAARVLKAKGRLFFIEFEVEDMRAGEGVEVEEMTFRRGGGVITHYFTEAEGLELFDMLRPVSILTDRRVTRIMGRDHLRSEVEAEFIKEEG